jgi:hypothetical protein
MPLGTLVLVPSYELEVTFASLDEESNIITRNKRYAIEGANFAAAAANRDLFLTDLGDATGALIIRARMTEVLGTDEAVTPTFNLYREMLITFVLDGAEQKRAAHAVPAPSLDFVAGKALNLGHATVTAYLNNFLATGGIVTISDGEFIRDANNVAASRIRVVRSGETY